MGTHTDVCISSLITELDSLAQPGSLPLCTVAKDDSLFLHYDSHYAGLISSADKLQSVLDLTLMLLGRLREQSGNNDVHQSDGAHDVSTCGGSDCDKYTANIMHILRCLKQAALDAINRLYFNIVEAHILHWHDFWQQRRHLDEGWFAEWPNGQRPLSTTWPWNVKPSLLVLWGVCWMFYGSPIYNPSKSRPTRNQRGAAPERDLRIGHGSRTNANTPHATNSSLFPTQPRQQYDSTPNTSSETWKLPVTTENYPNFSWPHPQQAGTRPTRANIENDSYPTRSHLTAAYDSTGTNNIPAEALQAYGTSVSADRYILGTSNVTTELLPAPQSTWPYCQGNNATLDLAYSPNYTSWQTTSPAYNSASTFLPTPQRTRLGSGLQAYGQQTQAANPQAARTIGPLGFGLGPQDMQNYPSPHSDVSHQTTSSTLSVLPGAMTSPRMLVASPSVAESSLSGRSGRRSLEAPRNASGMLYCDNFQCSRNPPVFARKCEWT